MKNSRQLSMFFILAFLCSSTLMEASQGTLSTSEVNSIDIKRPLPTVRARICWKPIVGPRVCITVTIEGIRKVNTREEFTVNASLSRDGQSILLSGFPTNFHGKSIKISDPDYSGFNYKGNKMFLKPGEYAVSKGKATVSLRKG